MSGLRRTAAFGVLLIALFGSAAFAGNALDANVPGRPSKDIHGRVDSAGHQDADGEMQVGLTTDRDARGRAQVDDGLRLIAVNRDLKADRTERIVYRIVDRADKVVNDFEVEHERAMHVILVRRDMNGYQHLHPHRTEDGSWEIDSRIPEAGSYRLFADFKREGRPYTLGTDLTVAGAFEPRPLPRPVDLVQSAGYEVSLEAENDALRFTVAKDGRPVNDLEPYLGARGHLVALREGDLAYLHVHARSDATFGRDIRFEVEYPSSGRYRLFLQFKHDGLVHTAEFTQVTK